jgi:hypothetical protein
MLLLLPAEAGLPALPEGTVVLGTVTDGVMLGVMETEGVRAGAPPVIPAWGPPTPAAVEVLLPPNEAEAEAAVWLGSRRLACIRSSRVVMAGAGAGSTCKQAMEVCASTHHITNAVVTV